MKIVFVFTFFFMNQMLPQGFNSGKWDDYIQTGNHEKEDFKNTYFLVKSKGDFKNQNALKIEDEIIRVLDANNYILKSNIQNICEYKNITYNYTNNLWKLSLLHTKDETLIQPFILRSSAPDLLIKVLKSKNIKINNEQGDYIGVNTNFKFIKEFILKLEHVVYVSNECIKPIQESDVEDLDLSINGFLKMKQLYPELKGESQVIGVKDNTPDMDDIDLWNTIEVSSIKSTEIDQHATDMATIIAGKGNVGVKGLGVLPDATIFPMDFNNLFPEDDLILNQANVSIVNNSYGTIIENFYGLLAQSYDQFLYENPTSLYIYSSGNSGVETSVNGPYTGISNYANLTGNFKMSKNSISVGAVDQKGNRLPFSSKGPAYDGRIKPEIVAFSVLGTSNACALVTSGASAIQQIYLQSEDELPPSSLIKGALLNGSDDVGRAGVDFETGYGNLNMPKSLDIINNKKFNIETIKSNESQNYEIIIPDNAENLKVMLVWTDIAALPNDNIALKNNLNLTLVGDGTVFFPSILNKTASLASIESIATTGIDNLNTVEQIVISEPNINTYTINVSASNLTTNDQEYSLVYTWDISDTFEWSYPLQGSYFPYNGGTKGYMQWNSTFDDFTTGSIEINYSDSLNWETIATNVMANQGFFEWELPQDIHTKARLRFVVEGRMEISEEFIISTGVELSTSLNCDDVTEIKWNKKEDTERYNVFNYQEGKKQLITTTIDTSFVFSKTNYPSPYFYVEPLLDTNTNSLASKTINISLFSENCYFNTIFPSLIDGGIQLNVSLGSIYDIDKITLFRVNKDNFLSEVLIIDKDKSLIFSVEDLTPLEGNNSYQFKITTNSGDEYFSQESSIFYFTEQKSFLVFPNPTTKENGITIFSSLAVGQTVAFELYDIKGQLVLQQNISSDRAFISLFSNNFSPGFYIYKIKGDSLNNEVTSKILIE